MQNILSKNKGASMLLAICIFMFLVVLGFNVLAAASSNINNTGEQFENEQAMQYVNSIYEIVNGIITTENEIKIIKPIPDTSGDEAFANLNVGDFKGKNGENIKVEVAFHSQEMAPKDIEAKISVTYRNRKYTISSIYTNEASSDKPEYVLEKCKGVESIETK